MSQLRDLRATSRGILSLSGDTMSPYGYTWMLLPGGHHVGHEPYLDCESGNRNHSAAFRPPAVSAAPDGISLRPRVSGAPGAVLFGCPLQAPSNSKRLLRRLRPVLPPRADRINGPTSYPPSSGPCSAQYSQSRQSVSSPADGTFLRRKRTGAARRPPRSVSEVQTSPRAEPWSPLNP